MATTKIWKVGKRLDHVIDYATNEMKTRNRFYKEAQDNFASVRQALEYATNPDKTEKKFYTTGINCEVENAVEQMIKTKKKYKKEKGILAFHAYQSFAKGEVNPETAHEIGVKLAEEMWGDRFEVVVSTHLNTKCIHNHFVLNSVSFKDGYKYYSNLENTALFRKTSDDICDEFGLKVLGEKECKSGINFENFYRKNLKNSEYYIFAKEDIDYAINHSWTFDEFEKRLIEMGYEIYYRAGKMSIRRYPHNRNIRIERTFGEDYSIENIKNKICTRYPIREEIIEPKTYERKLYYREKAKKLRKPKGIVALYYYYRFLLGLYPKHNLQHKLSPEMRKEVKKMEQYSEKIRFLCKHKIETISDVESVKENKKEEMQKILNTRNRLYYKRQKLEDGTEKDEITKLIVNVTSEVTKVRKDIKMCDEICKNVPKMKEQLKELDEKERQVQEEKEQKIKLKKKKRTYER